MKTIARWQTGLVALLVQLVLAGNAYARCTINAAGISITPVTASTGTYTQPTAPTAQAVTFTVSGTYDTNNTGANGGTCRVAISWNRASLPASMARSGGGATLPYTIQSLSGGGNTLLFTGGGTPGAGNRLLVTFGAAGRNLNDQPFSVLMTAYFLAQPGTNQRAGSYSDGPTVRIYNVTGGGTATQLASRAFTVNGTVSSVCTIGGVTNPAADNATIPVSSARRGRYDCDCQILRQRRLQLGHQYRRHLAKRRREDHGIARQRLHEHHQLFRQCHLRRRHIHPEHGDDRDGDGAEAGTTGTTAGTTNSGTMSVTITPQSAAQTLIGGSYADTLRITVTAQ